MNIYILMYKKNKDITVDIPAENMKHLNTLLAMLVNTPDDWEPIKITPIKTASI